MKNLTKILSNDIPISNYVYDSSNIEFIHGIHSSFELNHIFISIKAPTLYFHTSDSIILL